MRTNNDQLDSLSEQARFRWNWLLDYLLDRDNRVDDTIIVNETNESVSQAEEVKPGELIKYFLIGLVIGTVGGYLVLWMI